MNFSPIIVFTLSTMALGSNLGGTDPAGNIQLKSPNGKVVAKIFVDKAGSPSYSLARDATTIIEQSRLGIIVNGVDLGEGAEFGAPSFTAASDSCGYPWRGVKSKVLNRYSAVLLPVTRTSADQNWAIEARAYDDGFAYRCVVPGEGKRLVNGEKTTWRLPAGCQIWYQTNTRQYEGIHSKQAPEGIKKGQTMGLPITIELADGSFAAIAEAGLFNYSGMTVRATGTTVLEGVFEDDMNGWRLDGEIRSPWRVTMTGPELNALVNCDIVHNLCPPPDKSLFPNGIKTEWIKPGRALWHWWSGKMGDFNGVAFEKQKWWADNAAKMGFEYILVDAGWERKWSEDGNDKWVLLKELVKYAAKEKVHVWVWKRWAAGPMEGIRVSGLNDPNVRAEFFKSCADAGVVGVKIDFMDSESKERIDFYTNVLQDAAKYRLMINFHGANKPTGESRTFPNEMTREGIRGLEYNKWDTSPAQHYASLVFTRFLAGHGDFTPCTFNPEMLKGTTVTLQLATAIAFTSPIINWADKPELYLQSPAIEVLRNVPSVWDETVVLQGSRIGELAALARRKGTEWFVAVINGRGEKREYSFGLSFLSDGTYDATLVRDKIGEPGGMVVEQNIVNKERKVSAEMDGGGGFVGWFSHKGR